MSFLDDAISGIKERINIAANNTFASSFVVAWCFHNWKVFLYTFSTDPKLGLEARFVGIDSIVTNYWNILCFPFLIALGSTLGYPWLKFLVRFYNLEVLKHEKSITLQLGSHEVMPEEEANQLREKNNTLESNVKNLENEILQFNERINNITKEVQDLLIKNKLDYTNFKNLKIQNVSNLYPSNVGAIPHSILNTCDRDIVLEYSNLKSSPYFPQFKIAVEFIHRSKHFGGDGNIPDSVTAVARTYLIQFGILDRYYTLTPKGQEIYNIFIHDKDP
ncbi:MAG TPA: hypothetical protein PLW09_04835 [Candidatus Kapabacteria bacterium]|nr:hypothetical protein [Candidatus Kapabacteria bacterium]